MRIKKRKLIKRIILYILAIIVFTIVSFAVISFALGYNFDFKDFSFIRTGALVLKANHSQYDVLINDKKKFSKNIRFTVSGLLPKEYYIKVEKNGYFPWSKNITILPHKVTREENIFLIPQNLKPEKFWANLSEYQITKNQSYLIAKSANSLQRINIVNNKSESNVFIENIDFFKPDFGGIKVLIRQKAPEDRYIIMNFDNPNPIELTKEPNQISQIDWLPGNNQTLFLIYNNSLYSANTNEMPINFKLLKSNVVNFSFSNENITFLQLDNLEKQPQKLSLWQSDFSLNNSRQIIKELDSGTYEIINSPNGQSVLLKKLADETLYLVKDNALQKMNNSVKEAKWTIDNRKITYCTDSEIWIAEINDIGGIDNKLVSRYSNKISNLNWFFDNYHLVFAMNNKINIIETDGTNLIEVVSYDMDKQRLNLIENTEKISLFFLNKEKTSEQRIDLFLLKINKY